MVIAVALGALMVSRGVSTTVSDASQLQQQASYAFRVIGQQIRQAGALQLNLNDTAAVTAGVVPAVVQPDDRVAFMLAGYDLAAPAAQAVNGTDGPPSRLTVGYPNFVERTVAGGANTLFRDCLGQGGDAAAAPFLTSVFSFDNTKKELTCIGATGGAAQPVIRNVADFQVNYLLQTTDAAGVPAMQRVNAAGVSSNWQNVYAVEVCLELVGDEPIDLPAGSQYTDCSGTRRGYNFNVLNMSNRLRMVFRNTFQIRSQGVFIR
jgi:type IV pilus assembly protein PilW